MFDDGEAMNLNLLLTCRMVYNETGTVAFSTITYRLEDLGEWGDCSNIEERLQLVPLKHRNAIISVNFEEMPRFPRRDTYVVPSMPLICYPNGIFPVEVTHTLQNRFKTSETHLKNLRTACNLLGVERLTVAQRVSSPIQHGERPFFARFLGQWLENPRLRMYRLRGLPIYRYAGYEIVARRLDDDDTLMEEDPCLVVPDQLLYGLGDTKQWLRDHEVTAKEHNMLEGFIVSIKQKTSSAQAKKGLVRVHFTVHDDRRAG